jgi:hypothetical protein
MRSMKAARKDETRGVRPRPDQIDDLDRLQRERPELELTWSRLIRRGIDLAIAELDGVIQVPQGALVHRGRRTSKR